MTTPGRRLSRSGRSTAPSRKAKGTPAPPAARAVRLAGIVPALDAERTVGRVVRGALARLEHVVVVDDGSTDRTAPAAARAGAEVISHGENRGKGVALRTGLERLRALGFTHAVTIDADGQHLPREIPKLVAAALADPRAIVVGARQIDAEVAPLNLFGNAFANLWVRIAAGRDLGDTQCGFRVYPIEPVLALGATGPRFDFETEVLIRAVRAGLDVRSVPVRVHYPPPGERVSHYDKLWDTVRIVESVVGLLLHLR